MGYTTDFYGSFKFDRAIEQKHADYLRAFASTRRMKRNSEVAEIFADAVRLAAGLPIGPEGGYYVGSTDDYGQTDDTSVVDHNRPPAGQPGLWCQWTVSDDNTELEWDGGEKFYFYEEWLKYLIAHFISKWGYKLSGEVEWSGENREDLGILVVDDNQLTVKYGEIKYKK